MKLLGIVVSVEFGVIHQLLIIYSAFFEVLGNKQDYSVNQLVIDFKEAYGSVQREVFYNILIEFMPVHVVGLMKMCLNKTYRKVHIGRNCRVSFMFRMFRNKGMLYYHCFSTLL
jgi:hypothetical protein